MRLSDFDYQLPPELIAQFPSVNRSKSRFLYWSEELGGLESAPFAYLANLISPGDLIVVNNTRVIPARLAARKPSGGKVEIMLERLLDATCALVQIKSNKSIKDGQALEGDNFSCLVKSRQDRFYVVEFTSAASEVFRKYASIPLPPYIRRDPDTDDLERYQTVYSSEEGAVAAPTAGLHFDAALIQQLKRNGVGWGEITLHVGAGTFLPVQAENIDQHKMHSETLEVTEDLCNLVSETQNNGGKIWAVGTTVVRALETAAQNKVLHPYRGETSIFIKPGYQFQVVDRLITNFHLPKSTLLMLVSAFAGYDRVMRYYQYAIDQKLRFFSYGDAMLLSREEKV